MYTIYIIVQYKKKRVYHVLKIKNDYGKLIKNAQNTDVHINTQKIRFENHEKKLDKKNI